MRLRGCGRMARHFFLNIGAVAEEIESWRPRGCTRETEYRDSLYRKLEDAFRTPPTKEYGHGRVRADIAFERKIGIEIKKDLDSPTKLQRLKGQIQDMAKTFDKSVVVVVGDAPKDLLKDLRDTAYEYGVRVIKK